MAEMKVAKKVGPMVDSMVAKMVDSMV